ncbi:MAG: hypothetical protein H0V17_27695 [Deltaproteobacteria bacterium]|nr:hypothetical protein [Deltaproteobacteria bacterium]
MFTAGLCDPPATQGGAKTCPSGHTCGSQTNVCVSDAQHGPFGIVVSNPQAKAVTVVVTGPGGETITRTIAAGQVDTILPQAGNAIVPLKFDVHVAASSRPQTSIALSRSTA